MSRGTNEKVVPMRNDLMGSREVCELLSVPRSTLSRWIKRGRLRPYGITAASPVFTREYVRRFAEARSNENFATPIDPTWFIINEMHRFEWEQRVLRTNKSKQLAEKLGGSE